MNHERKEGYKNQKCQKSANTRHDPDVLSVAVTKVWSNFSVDKYAYSGG